MTRVSKVGLRTNKVPHIGVSHEPRRASPLRALPLECVPRMDVAVVELASIINAH